MDRLRGRYNNKVLVGDEQVIAYRNFDIMSKIHYFRILITNLE